MTNGVMYVSSGTYKEIKDQLELAGQGSSTVVGDEYGHDVEYLRMDGIYLCEAAVVEVQPARIGEARIG